MKILFGSGLLFSLISVTAFANPNLQRTDLPPSQVVSKILDESPAVQSANSGIDLGKANKRRLEAGPYEFNASLLGQRRKVGNAQGRLNEWAVEVERSFRSPGKGNIDSDIGDAGLDAANFAYRDAYHEAARLFLSQWFSWVKTKYDVEQWEAQAASLAEQRRIVARREKLGDAAQLEFSMVEGASAQADAALQQARARFQIATSVLTQSYPSLELPKIVTIVDPEPIIGSLELWRSQILEDDHNLLRAKAETLQANLQSKRARLDLIPDPTIGVQFGSEQGGNERYVGLRLTIPFPASTIRSANSDAALAQASITRQREAQITRDLLNNIDVGYVTAVSGYGSWQSAKLAKNSIEKNATKMARAYDLGEVGLMELLAAQRLRAETNLTFNATLIEAVEARYRLLLDSHQLWLPRGEEGKH